MARKKTFFEESLNRNKRAYVYYLNRLTELSVSMFEWLNLPETIDVRYLELRLFEEGKVVFFKDEVMGYLCLDCIANGQFDVYGNPIRRRAYSKYNQYQKVLNIEDSVIIWNNFLRTNSAPSIREYARKLALLDRIIDVNTNAQKTPVLLQGNEKQRLSLLNMYKEWDGNAPVIFGDKSLDIGSLTVLKTEAPYVSDKLYQLKTQIWNEALTYLGISNLNVQKKERLVSDEVTRSMGGTIASRYSRLESRRRGCELINDMFDLDINVNYREDYREVDDEFMLAGDTGDDKVSEQIVDLRTRSERVVRTN